MEISLYLHHTENVHVPSNWRYPDTRTTYPKQTANLCGFTYHSLTVQRRSFANRWVLSRGDHLLHSAVNQPQTGSRRHCCDRVCRHRRCYARCYVTGACVVDVGVLLVCCWCVAAVAAVAAAGSVLLAVVLLCCCWCSVFVASSRSVDAAVSSLSSASSAATLQASDDVIVSLCDVI